MRIQKEFLNHHSQKDKAKQRGLFVECRQCNQCVKIQWNNETPTEEMEAMRRYVRNYFGLGVPAGVKEIPQQ